MTAGVSWRSSLDKHSDERYDTHVRIKIEVTVDVDARGWAEEYGCEVSEVRSDVKRWAQNRLNSYDDDIARVVAVR